MEIGHLFKPFPFFCRLFMYIFIFLCLFFFCVPWRISLDLLVWTSIFDFTLVCLTCSKRMFLGSITGFTVQHSICLWCLHLGPCHLHWTNRSLVKTYSVDGWKTGSCRSPVITALVAVVASRRPPATTLNTPLFLINKTKEDHRTRVVNMWWCKNVFCQHGTKHCTFFYLE